MASGSTEHNREQEPVGPASSQALVEGGVPRSCAHQDPQPLFLYGPVTPGLAPGAEDAEQLLVSCHPCTSSRPARHGAPGPPSPPAWPLPVRQPGQQHVVWCLRITPAQGTDPDVPLRPLPFLLCPPPPRFSQAALSFAATPRRPPESLTAATLPEAVDASELPSRKPQLEPQPQVSPHLGGGHAPLLTWRPAWASLSGFTSSWGPSPAPAPSPVAGSASAHSASQTSPVSPFTSLCLSGPDPSDQHLPPRSPSHGPVLPAWCKPSLCLGDS